MFELSQNQMTILLVGLVFGALFGPLTARSSNRREPIYGGLPAHFFHILAAIALVAPLPSILTGLVLGEGLLGLPIAISLLLSGFVFLLIFAAFENPARIKHKPEESDEPGWTAEDAMKSGL